MTEVSRIKPPVTVTPSLNADAPRAPRDLLRIRRASGTHFEGGQAA